MLHVNRKVKTINKIITLEIGTRVKTVTGTISPYPTSFYAISTNDTGSSKNSSSTDLSKISSKTIFSNNMSANMTPIPSGLSAIATNDTDSNKKTLPKTTDSNPDAQGSAITEPIDQKSADEKIDALKSDATSSTPAVSFFFVKFIVLC